MFIGNDTLKQVTDADRRLFLEIEGLLRKGYPQNPDPKQAKGLKYECHSISRAVYLKFKHKGCVLVDGFFLGFQMIDDKIGQMRCKHSWVMSADGAIIDPYPVGRISLGPILVVTKGEYVSYAGNHYLPDSSVTQTIGGRDMWRRARVLLNIMNKELASHAV